MLDKLLKEAQERWAQIEVLASQLKSTEPELATTNQLLLLLVEQLRPPLSTKDLQRELNKLVNSLTK